MWGLYHHGMDTKYGGHGSGSMDDSRVGTVISNSDMLETRGESALELATSSRCVFVGYGVAPPRVHDAKCGAPPSPLPTQRPRRTRSRGESSRSKKN